MLSKHKIGQFFFLLALMIGGFLLAKNVFALDVGTNEIGNAIQLGATDPRTIVARIINVAMMFLGIIAVGIIILAGFKWMSSQGNEEQIESAKKILKAGVIGLVIILASWGIAAFILNRLIDATGNGGNGGGNNNGGGTLPPCSGNGCQGMACDDLPLVPGCNYSTSSCQAGLACSPSSCTCQPCPASDPNCSTDPGGSFGDTCDGDLNNATCDADNNMCDANQGLTCDANTCTCLGSPVITAISPVGGFCEADNNQACDADGDCSSVGGLCNIDIPNGAANNIISIHGYNFGDFNTSTAGLNQVVFLGDENDQADDKMALEPSAVNPVCNDSWTNNEIIAVIPAGAGSGPMKVKNGSLNSNLIDFDTTNNPVGPSIPNFLSNSIVRPGICRITPDNEVMGGSVSYWGNNLSGAGYFGNDANKFKGISSTFNSSNTSGYVLVPNVGAGYMSTFIITAANQKSNYVAFRKNQEPPASPSISSFEPDSGNIGQYITIRGNGFGNSRGASQVFFENTEAGYNFPAVCLQSVWSDNQVIVKVPSGLSDGAYTLKMKIGAWEQISSANTFTVDSSASLLPSLCKIEPSRGPVNASVSFYGEYFSSSTSGIARFYNGRDSAGNIVNDNGANKLTANVPLEAVTGPVKVVDNARIGNSLNFLVGACSNNNECDSGTPYCCPFGSPKQGQCAIALMNSTNGCYNNIPTSVFEWTFGTTLAAPCDSNLDNATCDASDVMCSSATMQCDPTTCTCQPCPENDPVCGTISYYSCAQQGGGDSCPTGTCPNSPGQCSPYAGGQSQTIGTCQESCNNIPGCNDDSCVYNRDLNKCVRRDFVCNEPKILSYTLPGNLQEQTAEIKCTNGHWVMNTNSSCPDGFNNIGGNKCQSLDTCNSCTTGFACNDNQCVNNSVICASGSVCEGSQCVKNDSASCECCCEIGNDSRDCCGGVTADNVPYQLTCAGTCGKDTIDDAEGYGSCSGCSAVGTTVDENDAACNCSGTSGKICEDNICTDCTGLSEGDCTNHAASCCWDDKDDICRGGNGKLITDNPEHEGKYGHCAFYTCASAEANTCRPQPNRYSTSSSITSNYIYKNSNQCTGCTFNDLDLACALTSSESDCREKNGCCWDMGTTTPKCTAGNKVPSTGDVPGACDYFSCQSGQNNSDQCVATSSALSVGPYANWNSCSAGCRIPHLGASCNSFATTTSFTAQTCNLSMCSGAGFSCMVNTDPFLVTSNTTATAGGCGFCCCDPTADDACSGINSALKCLKDKGNCSGDNRGLCCGCQNDSQCGGGDTMGCSADSCCYDRPKVESTNPAAPSTAETNSVDPSLNVCRNSIISVTFNKKMDRNSLNNNFVLLAESSDNTCPAGTSHLALTTENNHQNIFSRIFARVIRAFERTSARLARLINPKKAMALPINPDAYYCVTPGVAIYDENVSGHTVLNFTPTAILQPDTNYVAIVKGQDNLSNLASSTALGKGGVLSLEKVGMAGTGLNNGYYFGPFGVNGPVFSNSYIWNFKTLNDNSATSGLCLVDRVELTPPAYIFQKNTNDSVNENDASSADSTFDTMADRDKLYTAKALSSNGQELQPIAAYDWSWEWNISDTSKINLVSVSDLAGNGKRRLLSVQPGISDDTVSVTASTVMNPSNAYLTASKNKTVQSRVFVCSNPWPPVNSIYQWEPSRDTAIFGNYTYEFYYCRDAGDPTPDDDLPAISSGDDIVNLGLSSRRVCSNNRNFECDNNDDCPSGGFCIPDILKESYFFQQ